MIIRNPSFESAGKIVLAESRTKFLIDPSHVSYLHRFINEDPREQYGQQFAEKVEGTDVSLSSLVGANPRPDIEV